MTWYERHRSGYRARWTDQHGKQPAGETKPTKEEARAWAVERGLDRPAPMTMQHVLDQWRKVRRVDGDASDEYLDECHDRLEDLCATRSWIQVQDITLAAIDEWKIAVGGVGVDRTLSYLLSVLRWGALRLDAPVATKVLAYKRARRARDHTTKVKLTAEQFAQVMDRAAGFGPQIQALHHYLGTYGPRPKTACSLRVEHVLLARGKLAVHNVKHSGSYEHELLEQTVALFGAIIGDRPPSDPLFLDPRTGKAWKLSKRGEATALGCWYRWHVAKALKFPADRLGIYQLKYYAITWMLQKGIDPATVAKFTGHLDVSQVLTYARTDDDAQAEALQKISGSVHPMTTHPSTPARAS